MEIKNLYIALVLYLATIALVAAIDEPIEEPEVVKGTSPEPEAEAEPGFNEAVEICAAKMSHECGEEIYDSVFKDNEHNVSQKCCISLVSIGQHCHNTLVREITLAPEFASKSYDVVPKRDATWKKCVQATAA